MGNTRKRKRDGKLNVIGENIKFYREKAGISYQKLSDKLMILGIDIHKQALYNIEIGIRTVVDYELCAIAKCLNITINDLVKDYWEEINSED